MCGLELVQDPPITSTESSLYFLAAHCLNNGIVFSRKLKYLVFLGKHKLHKYSEAGAQVEENFSEDDRYGLIVHEDYELEKPEADIAIIKLASKVRFNNFVSTQHGERIFLFGRSFILNF